MRTLRDFACFFSGVGAGMAAAVLLTPRTGADVRNQLREKVDQGAQALRRGKAAAEQAVDREMEGVGAAIDAGKRAYLDTTGRGRGETDAQPAG
jgi:hypothetical protein